MHILHTVQGYCTSPYFFIFYGKKTFKNVDITCANVYYIRESVRVPSVPPCLCFWVRFLLKVLSTCTIRQPGLYDPQRVEKALEKVERNHHE